jgi:hypothetical protein
MMNYREESISDQSIERKFLTGAHAESNLCEALSRMTIVTNEKQPMGLFARIKSTIFTSHESQIRTPFAASAVVTTPENTKQYVCLSEDGVCRLLLPNSSTATELSTLQLPEPTGVYSMSSLFLGTRHGSLVAVSLGSGEIVLITVKDSSMSLTKKFTVPVTCSVTRVYLNERDGLVELFVVLEDSELMVIPDITKFSKYAFVFTDRLHALVREWEVSTVSFSCLSQVWDNRSPSSDPECPMRASLFVGTKHASIFGSKEEFFVELLVEKIIELVLVKSPSFNITNMIRSEIRNRVSREIVSNPTPSSIILGEVSRLVSTSSTKKISAIDYDRSNGKTVIAYTDGTASEIVPISDPVQRYVLTFLCAPVTFSKISNLRLSRENALDLFDGSDDWKAVFSGLSAGSALGSLAQIELLLNDPKKVEKLILENFASTTRSVPELATHLAQTHVVKGSADRLVRMIKQSLTKQVVGFAEFKCSVFVLSRLCRAVLAESVYESKHLLPDAEMIRRIIPRIRNLAFILDQYPVSFPPSKPLGEFIEKLHLEFFDPRVFRPEISFISTLSDTSAITLGRFHFARSLALSPNDADRDTALRIFRETEIEISPVLALTEKSSSKNSYYRFLVSSVFTNDYPREIELLSLMMNSGESGLMKQIIEKAIANADWSRVKSMLARADLAPDERDQCIRLLCTEARLRGAMGKVFELIKTDSNLVKSIILEVEIDIKSDDHNLVENGVLLFNLYVYIGDFAGAVNAAYALYERLLCDYSRPGKKTAEMVTEFTFEPHSPFDYIEFSERLDNQLKSLILARSIISKCTHQPHVSLETLSRSLAFLKGLRAFYSYTTEPVLEVADPATLCRHLSAMGLVVASSDIAKLFRLDVAVVSLIPFCELMFQCHKDASFLPPCRLTNDADLPLFQAVTPAMAFMRSDRTGPIGTAGDQLKAMTNTLEKIISESHPSVLVDMVEFFLMHSPNNHIPSFLVNLAEDKGLWLVLLKAHMRRENFAEAVRLVETHVKFWMPGSHEDQIMLNVPLLVQLQQALEMVDEDTLPNADKLLCKLEDALETLKETLSLVSQRTVRK